MCQAVGEAHLGHTRVGGVCCRCGGSGVVCRGLVGRGDVALGAAVWMTCGDGGGRCLGGLLPPDDDGGLSGDLGSPWCGG